MDRSTIARLCMLNDLIDKKERMVEEIRSKALDPVGGSIVYVKSNNNNGREDVLLTYLDRVAFIREDLNHLHAELKTLQAEIQQELKKADDYYTAKVVEWRLLKCYTWKDCADLSGFSVRSCQKKYDRWCSQFE